MQLGSVVIYEGIPYYVVGINESSDEITIREELSTDASNDIVVSIHEAPIERRAAPTKVRNALGV